jgi:hypothetical protein
VIQKRGGNAVDFRRACEKLSLVGVAEARVREESEQISVAKHQKR